MAKFKLVERPKVIPHTVRCKDIDGKDLTLKVEFNYRGRAEYSKLVDGANINADKEDDSLSEIVQRADTKTAEVLCEALHSWDLEEELNIENATMLIDQHQAMANAIMSDYRDLCLTGKMGN